MQHPAVCPICDTPSCEMLGYDFKEFTSIIEQYFYCHICDSEWKVPFVMAEKIITHDGQEIS